MNKIIKITMCLFLGFVAVFSFSCKSKVETKGICKVDMIVGTAQLERKGKTEPLKVKQELEPGDSIHTGADSLVIASFTENLAQVEIQANTSFSIDTYNDKNKDLSLEKGNLWLKVSKLKKGEEFRLHSRTAIAAVRGTKFYTFEIGGIQGTCQCSGETDFRVKQGANKTNNKIHKKDRLILTRGDKTIELGPEDFPVSSPGEDPHKHSMLENSPLGPKTRARSPEDQKKFMALIEKKFKEAP
ncbi:MAG: FecR domain-containing protein [bacterium]|nr:FecR domain-containing protein [bacterium]